MAMKRNREDTEAETPVSIADCLMLLPRVGDPSPAQAPAESTSGRVYHCKTCDRAFPSFQALGGHRASHKKPKLGADLDLSDLHRHDQISKPKTHECSICGLEFAIGQALGGHMRRHRAAMSGPVVVGNSHPAVAVLKRSSSSSKRIWGLDLSLGLGIEIETV